MTRHLPFTHLLRAGIVAALALSGVLSTHAPSSATASAELVGAGAPTVGAEWQHWEVVESLPDGFVGLRRVGELVVGYTGNVDAESDNRRAAAWSPINGLQVIGPPGSEAIDATTSGEVLVSQEQQNFVWSSGSVRTLGNAGVHTRTTAMNNAGVVVGWARTSEDPAAPRVPVRWIGSTPEPLTGVADAEADAINDSGVIAGVMYPPGGDPRAFRWTPDAVQVLPGMLRVRDMNNDGQVVGANLSQPVRARAGSSAVELLVPAAGFGDTRSVTATGDILGVDSRGPAVWPGGLAPITLPRGIEDRYLSTYTDLSPEREFVVVTYPDVPQPPPGSVRTLVIRPRSPGAVFDVLAVQNADLPTYNWVDSPGRGIYAGTPARIHAELRNPTANPHLVELEVLNHATGQRVDGGYVVDGLDPGEKIPVNVELDLTAAWQDGAPRSAPTFDAVLSADGTEWDRQQITVPVRPRPLILVHGFNADASTWQGYRDIVRTRNPRWDVFAVGDGQAPGAMSTGSLADPLAPADSIQSNAHVVAAYVRQVRNAIDAEHVDIVAHSMGGLISRQYVDSSMPMANDGTPVATHLVMLGTPNHGSPCADLLPLASMWELRPDVLEKFNQTVVNRHDVQMSVLAGVIAPKTCLDDVPGDGVVPLPSALTGWTDAAVAVRSHVGLTGQEDFDSFVAPHLIDASNLNRTAAAPKHGHSINPSINTAPSTTVRHDAISTSANHTGPVSADLDNSRSVLASQPVHLDAGEVRNIPVEVHGASALSAVAPLPAGWTITLIDPNGNSAGSTTNTDGDALSEISTSAQEPVAPGVWSIRITANDNAAGTLVTMLAADSTVLAHNTTTVEEGGVRTTATLTADGADVSDATGEVTFQDPVSGTAQTSSLLRGVDGQLSAVTSGLTEGDYIVTTRLARGNLTAVDVARLTLTAPTGDVHPPTTTVIVATDNGSGWHNTATPVAIDAEDDESGVQEIAWSSTGAQLGGGIDPSSHIDVTINAEGTTTITAHATDIAGNVGAPATATVKLDLTDPAVVVNSPRPDQRVHVGDILPATFACSDPLSGVDTCSGSVATGTALPTQHPGQYQLQVTATDRAGNAHTVSVAYTVEADAPPPVVPADTTNPTLQLDRPRTHNGWYRRSPTVSLQATDPPTGNGPATPTVIHWHTEGAQSGEGQATGGTTVRIATPGTTRLTTWAVDAAGNQSVTKVSVLRLDKAPPRIVVRRGGPGRPPQVRCHDPLSGVATCRVVHSAAHRLTAVATDLAGNTTRRQLATRRTADSGAVAAARCVERAARSVSTYLAALA